MILEQEHDLKIHITVFPKKKRRSEIQVDFLKPEVLVLLVSSKSSYNVTSTNSWKSCGLHGSEIAPSL